MEASRRSRHAGSLGGVWRVPPTSVCVCACACARACVCVLARRCVEGTPYECVCMCVCARVSLYECVVRVRARACCSSCGSLRDSLGVHRASSYRFMLLWPRRVLTADGTLSASRNARDGHWHHSEASYLSGPAESSPKRPADERVRIRCQFRAAGVSERRPQQGSSEFGNSALSMRTGGIPPWHQSTPPRHSSTCKASGCCRAEHGVLETTKLDTASTRLRISTVRLTCAHPCVRRALPTQVCVCGCHTQTHTHTYTHTHTHRPGRASGGARRGPRRR